MANPDWNSTKVASFEVQLYPGPGDDSPAWVWLRDAKGAAFAILRFYRGEIPAPTGSTSGRMNHVTFAMSDLPIVLALLRDKSGLYLHVRRSPPTTPGGTVSFLSTSSDVAA